MPIPTKASEIKPISEVDRAYLAGVVDGEGCVSVATRLKKYLTPTIQITNTNKGLVDWIFSLYGGNVDPRKDKRATRKPSFCWRTAGAKAIRFLTDVFPYLRVKLPQAKILLAIPRQSTKQRDRLGRIKAKMTTKDFEKNRQVIASIRKLNKRGR